ATAYRDLPGFGWSIIARQPADVALADTRELAMRTLPMLAVTAALLLVLAVCFGRFLARPVTRLTLAATDLARGNFSSPVPGERCYREVALLSAALARLQSAATTHAVEATDKQTTFGGVLAA